MKQPHVSAVAAWTVVFIFSVPDNSLSQTRIEIAERDHLTDGWIRTDNRLVAETKQPRYLWDTRGERTGHHFITVHAVDDAWNRAATRIPVQLERTSPTVRSDGLN